MSNINIFASKNGGNTFSDPRVKSLGNTGDFCQPIVCTRWGEGRQWVFGISITDDCIVDILGVSAQIEQADE